MNPVLYALLTYGITAAISFLIVGIIVAIDRLMRHKTGEKDGEER